MASSTQLHRSLIYLASLLWLTACLPTSQQERDEEQRVVRAQRLARARAERARRARRERFRKQQQAGGTMGTVQPPVQVPSGPCEPAKALSKRVESGLNDQFAAAVRLVLSPIHADLVVLKGKPFQRFTFTVPMHPDEEPRFGRPRARAELVLDLRFVPLCGAGTPGKLQHLRVGLVQKRKGKRDPKAVNGLWPHRSARRAVRVQVGVPIQLMLDPSRATLGPGSPSASKATLGVWEVRGARFAGRKRTRRLSLPTSKQPDALRQLHVVEVACGQNPTGRCRFLTRRLGRRTLVTSWKELLTLAAPLQGVEQVRQLHTAALSLRFPRCSGDVRRTPGQLNYHRCFRAQKRALHCQYWRAFKGYGNEPQITGGGGRFHVHHVISCPGKVLRILALRADYGPKARYELTVTDLAPKASRLLERVRKSSGRRRRRRRRR